MNRLLLLLLAFVLVGCPQAEAPPSEVAKTPELAVEPGQPWTLSGVRTVEGRLVNLVIEQGRLKQVGEGQAGPVLDGGGLTVVPGFIDTHVHLGFYQPRQVVEGGLTTVRDLGWVPRTSLGWVEASADPRWGPTVLAVGPMVTVEGGYPSQAGWAPKGTASVYAPNLVEELAREGVCAIKVTLQPGSGPTLNLAQLKDLVTQAHEEGLKVTAHVSTLPELEKALEAEVDELAHFVFDNSVVPESLIHRMVKLGVTVVPTLRINPSAPRLKNLGAFAKAGGKVVYGTDMGNGGGPGIDVRELELMQKAGMTPEQVLHSATVGAADHLGLSDRGRLEEGAFADFLLVKGDPRQDWGVLKSPLLVVREGELLVNRLTQISPE